MTEYIVCPFCGEGDYDLIGLKYHIERGCQAYDDTISVAEEHNLRVAKDKYEADKG